MTIEVTYIPHPVKVDVEVIEHDCYELEDYTVEEFSFYRPTQEQVNNNTDHDEVGYMAVCNHCGEDMEHIDLSDYGIRDDDDDWRDE